LYSGDFVVENRESRVIKIADWSGFGTSRPSEGFIVPNGKKFSHFPSLSHLPEFTVVTWAYEDDVDEKTYSQRIELLGIIPPNTSGETSFVLGDDALWTVSFVRPSPN